MYVTNRQKTEQKIAASGAPVWWLLAEEHGVPNFEMRYFELAPGAETKAGHHPWEHEVFIVKGSGTVAGADGEHTVGPGDALFIAPDEPHQFMNRTNETLGFICVVPKGVEKRA
ncbi:MAG TPA: cupin domain-containing protein [Candidatus Hydrogenedentes bacterium]|nr:cupin domain-containing protein [Candidatus Hydrogenedentota bacterium]HPG66242.1 cupin domain-containing protein [Candidatus Hydrogenedentota bacterium]